MIDLIIPYYNNRVGLLDTLKSINTNIFKITIIDDHSTETPIIDTSVAQVFRLNINGGPGNARQHGINKTNNPYIMFIDTGDIFISKEIQVYIANVIQANPEANVISFPYYYKETITSDKDNRMHGKVYRREFLNQYGITFAPDGSYIDEDIGFNRACRLCTDILFMSKPVIKWIESEESLTQKNNNESLYKNQTYGLAVNMIHAIEICRKNHKDVNAEINQIAIALYYWFIRTAAERPKFLIDAWNGAKIFYKHFSTEIKPNQLTLGNAYIKRCLQYKDKISFQINILRFADEILKNKNLPNYYLT